MTTKTLTITEDAYNLLKELKLEDESFSEEIKRVLAKRNLRPLTDFAGILSDEEGEAMLRDLEKIRDMDIRLLGKRVK